ncbi:MAG: NB-ARC domain-containing protein, partial [Chloroflexota bacterium]
MPSQLTPFIGRTNEIAEIISRLTDPACRLLTLVGPGGIGKTRLSIQAATHVAAHFAQGVHFVPLQAVQSANFLCVAISDALKAPRSGPEEPVVQLLHYLRDRQILLVLDDFEPLLGADSATLLTQILTSTLAVKLLVTSREVLNLQEEWLYPVQGLPFPAPPPQPSPSEGEGVAAYAAVQLFNERARQVRPNFSLAAEQAEVIRICQLVEGMPLALELAASWTKTLSCAVIVAEIQRNLDFLSTSLRNVPDRQRSVRAVFDHSWQLLSEAERSAFKRLAVFRGGFQREAAERVAGASLATLSALVDKSLLRGELEGRYQMHELLRQYAAEHLAQSPADVGRMYDRHCAYYTDFLQERARAVIGARQRQVIRELTAELENIRAAWQWAVAQRRITDLQKAIYPYSQICDFQSRYREAADAFEQAIQSLESAAPSPERELTLAVALTFLGWDYVRLGRLESAQTMFERGQAIFTSLDVPPPQEFGADPLNGLALVAHILGNYAEATRLAEQALVRNTGRTDKLNLQLTLYTLANAAF